jgi:hypothetical protein
MVAFTNVVHIVPFVLLCPLIAKVPLSSARLARLVALVRRAAQPRFLADEYLFEMTHHYSGPTGVICRYLREQARPTDEVLANYDQECIAFYTDLKVVRPERWLFPNTKTQVQPFDARPDWIIPRRARRFSDELRGAAETAGYAAIVLPAVDIPWGNKPDPTYHKFRTVVEGEPVVIYRARRPGQPSSRLPKS